MKELNAYEIEQVSGGLPDYLEPALRGAVEGAIEGFKIGLANGGSNMTYHIAKGGSKGFVASLITALSSVQVV